MIKILNLIDKIDFKKYQFQFFYILISCISLLYILKMAFAIEKKYCIFLAIIVLMIEIFYYFFLQKKVKQRIEIHKLYLILIIGIGLLYIFAFPPSQIPDETSDYLRSLEVSEMHLISVQKGKKVGRKFSRNIYKVFGSKSYDDYLENSDEKLVGKKDFMIFPNKSLYAFICYIPQAIGIGIGRILKLPIVYQLLFGKLINFSLFVVLTYLSIKYIPTKKNLLLLICMFPITIQEATSLSADCMTIATSISLVSFIAWARNKKMIFKRKHYISLFLLSVCLSLCKIVYLPICFLTLLIPKENFKNLKSKLFYCTILLLTVIMFNLIWLKISSAYLIAFNDLRNSNSQVQLAYIITNPISYLVILFNTIDINIYSYLEQMVGLYLGPLTIRTSSVFVILTLGLLVYFIAKKDTKKESELSNIEKMYALLIIIGTTLLIFTSLYLQWTEVYAKVIDGVQGRYFIPLLPLIGLLFMTKNDKNNKINLFALTTMFLFNLLSIMTIFTTYI